MVKIFDILASPRMQLILSAMSPIFLIAALRFFGTSVWNLTFVVSCLSLFAAGVYSAIHLGHEGREGSSEIITLSQRKDEGVMAAAYLSTYVLPLIVGYDTSFTTLIALLIYVFVAMTIFWRSDVPVTNPLLYLQGYRLFTIHTKEGFSGFVLYKGRNKPREGDQFRLIELSTDVAYMSNREEFQ